MNKEKIAVISCSGLGDGIVSLYFSHNLYINGMDVTTYHEKLLFQLQPWFCHLPIVNYGGMAPQEFVDEILLKYDKIFVGYSSTCPYILKLILEGKRKFANKICVINPSFSKYNGTQPYYSDAMFSNEKSMIKNFQVFCKTKLLLPKIELDYKKIISPQASLLPNKNNLRVIIHASCSNILRSWPINKFITLAKKIHNNNYYPVFVVSNNEYEDFKFLEAYKFLELQAFDSLSSLASYLYESRCFIGNDSGVGHLAALLGLPTVSIFRNKRAAKLWQPAGDYSTSIYPSSFIPNIKRLRWRDRYWKKLITTSKVFNNFKKLM
jgi:hypothetical protein